MNFFSHYKITAITLTIVLSLILTAAAFFGTLQFINSDEMIHGLKVAGIKIGGLNFDGAKNVLERRLEEFKQQQIILIYNEKTWRFSPSALGIGFDLEKTANQAAFYGHRPNIFWGAKDQAESLLFGKNLPMSLSFDAAQFEKILIELNSIENPATNAKMVFEPTKGIFTILPESQGMMVDRDRLKNSLIENFEQFSDRPIILSLKKDQPEVTAKALWAVRSQAEQIISQAPYFVKTGSLSWPVDSQELTQWISALPSSGSLTLDEKEIKDFLSQIATTVNDEPVNAKLTVADGKIKVFALSQEGHTLNIEASAKKIIKGVLAGQTNIDLIIDPIEPEIATENIDNLGLTSLIGVGESNFAGSSASRQHNIALAASKLNGWLIAPGQEFSFSENIGPIDGKSGYQLGLIIKNKQTIPEYGGGVCQVSTTLFRAAVNSGLKVTERYPHAYPVQYYNPPGFDATVYPPKPDLKFINDTPAYILLQTKIEKTKLIFEVYGTAGDRQVKIIGPTITQSNPNGSLKTILTQEIWRDGILERQDIFLSSYNSPSLYQSATTPSPSPSPSPSASPSATPSPSPTAAN